MNGARRPARARVLVVDDDPDLRESLAQMLEREGYRVDTAADGREALATLREHRYRVVVTDLIMPDQDGIETIFAMGRQSPGTRVVAMTGGGQLEDPEYYLRLALRAGAFRALAKPFAGPDLVTAIRDALEGR